MLKMTELSVIKINETFKREPLSEKCKKQPKTLKNNENMCKNEKNIAKNQAGKSNAEDIEIAKTTAYVKALFTVYPSIPNIVKVIDNIVMQRASSIVPLQSVYSGVGATMNEIEKVIDMSDRKVRLLNIVAIVREILSGLSENDYQIIDMKFFKRMKTSTIAGQLGVDERSVFRRTNKAIERSVIKCSSCGYGSRFFECELQGEAWIKEIYYKSMSELSANKLRGRRIRKA